MTRLILLAAGSSRRFGENKLMWMVDGKPMMRHILDILLRLERERGWEVTVVAQEGPAADMARGLGARVAINAASELGISTSIRAALYSFSGAPCPAAFFVADQPYITGDTIARFMEAFAGSGKGLGCVAHGGELGNPAVFSPEYFPELMAIRGDRGGKSVIKRHMDDCYIHQVADARELRDIDTRPF